MSTLVDGLRPTNTTAGNSRKTRKEGRVVPQRSEQRQVRLAPAAAPVDTYVRPTKQDGVGDSARMLAETLSSISPQLAKYANTSRQKEEDAQMAKVRQTTALFMKDREMGAVEATQVKEMFPELSPTVAARIAQSTGELQAKEWALEQVRGILEDDSVRLNTQNRQGAIASIRDQALEMAQSQDGFYGSGFLSQVDKSMNEFETSWMRETAAYHEDVQAQSFSAQVSEALKGGGDLLALDDEWKQSSSLNNLERNKILVETVTAEAAATNNAALLKGIPQRFLNAETKAAVAKTSQQIETARYSQWVRGKEIQSHARSEATRQGKMAMIEKLSSGGELNPSDYRNNPDLFEYALRMNSQPTMDTTKSISNGSTFRSNILRAGSTGEYREAFASDPQFLGSFNEEGQVSEQALRDHILSRDDLNGPEKQKLIQDIPMLMEGSNLMRDPDVNTFFNSAVDDDLKVFAQSIPGQTLQFKGINAQGAVRRRFYDTLQAEVQAYIEDNNAVPRGSAKLDLMRKAETAAMSHLTQLQASVSKATPVATPTPAAEKKTEAKTDKPKGGTGKTITLPNGQTITKLE